MAETKDKVATVFLTAGLYDQAMQLRHEKGFKKMADLFRYLLIREIEERKVVQKEA